MKTNIVWKAIDALGLEHLQVFDSENGIEANGTIVKTENQASFSATYRVRCDADWRVRGVEIDLLDENNKTVALRSDGAGNWTDAENNLLPDFDGCFDIDISATPFTNTLPICRLRLAPGESANVSVVYFTLPRLSVQKSTQRYTFLERNDDRAIYLFEELGVSKGFEAEITVDESGFVVEYPNLFERVRLP